MLRWILIPLDSLPYSQAALNWGCYAAKRTDANLIVIGAHLKKGITDFMVNSLMKHLLRNENKYLLIGQ
jgi:hypothetical protein